EYAQRRAELGVEDDLAALEGLNGAMLVALGEAGVKTLDDFADLSSDELIARDDGLLRAFNLSADHANTLIMAARAHWFDDEEPAEAEAEAEVAADGDKPASAV
ncbi:MAG: transcription termination/antitermination protein NusA, partial [Alphaproteobacteria bacterium]